MCTQQFVVQIQSSGTVIHLGFLSKQDKNAFNKESGIPAKRVVYLVRQKTLLEGLDLDTHMTTRAIQRQQGTGTNFISQKQRGFSQTDL